MDSAASDCFVREKFLTENIPLEEIQCIIRTACKNRDIIVRNACMLPFTIRECTDQTRFLVCDELRTDVTLDRTWLEAQKAVHDHDLDCLYIGDKMGRRVYLTNNNNAPPESVAPPVFFVSVQHGCPNEYAPKLEALLLE